MLFESTTILLRSIVHSTENNGEVGWEDHLESGNQCLYELHRLARSSARTSKASNSKFPVVALAFERAIRAIPHVKLMMRSLCLKDQSAAVESGRIAIGEMNGIKTALPSVSYAESKPAITQPVARPEEPAKSKAHQHKATAKQKHVRVTKRKTVKVSAAAGSRRRKETWSRLPIMAPFGRLEDQEGEMCQGEADTAHVPKPPGGIGSFLRYRAPRQGSRPDQSFDGPI
jgi:hypothetical protein